MSVDCFDVMTTGGEERLAAKRDRDAKIAAATYDVREKHGPWLFGAADVGAFKDRVALCYNDIARTIDKTLPARTSSIKKVVKNLEHEFSAMRREAAEDGVFERSQPDHPEQHLKKTFQDHQGEELIPEGNFHAYQDRVDQGGPSKVESHDFTDVGTTRRHDHSDSGNFVPTVTGRRHEAIWPFGGGGSEPEPPAEPKVTLLQPTQPKVTLLRPTAEQPAEVTGSREFQLMARMLHGADALSGATPGSPIDLEDNGHSGLGDLQQEMGQAAVEAKTPGGGFGMIPPGAGLPTAPHTGRRLYADDLTGNDPNAQSSMGAMSGAPTAAPGGAAAPMPPANAAAAAPIPPVTASAEYHQVRAMLHQSSILTMASAQNVASRIRTSGHARVVIAAALTNDTAILRVADRNYLQQADEAITKVLNEKAEEFQNTIAPLQQALVTIQQAEALQNPLNVQPPAGTVNVLPQGAAGGADPAGGAPAAGGDPAAGGQAPQGAGGLGADPAAAALAGQPQQLAAAYHRSPQRWLTEGNSGSRHPFGDRRRQADVVEEFQQQQQKQPGLPTGGEADIEPFVQKNKVGPRAQQKLRQNLGLPAGPNTPTTPKGSVVPKQRRVKAPSAGGSAYGLASNRSAASSDWPQGLTPGSDDEAREIVRRGPGAHPDYHRAKDRVDRLDRPGPEEWAAAGHKEARRFVAWCRQKGLRTASPAAWNIYRRTAGSLAEPGYVWSKAPVSVKGEFANRVGSGQTPDDTFREMIAEITEHHRQGMIGEHDAHRAANEALGRLMLSRRGRRPLARRG